MLIDNINCIIVAYAVTIYLSSLDATVIQGGSARFECGYTGHESIAWKINERYYTALTLPAKHSVMDTGDFSLLIVRNADLQMNGSTYQCLAGSVRSSNIHLYVFPGM